MDPAWFALAAFVTALGAGGLGSMLGLGGGLVLVPVLTSVLHVDIHVAIAASIVAVVATSMGAATVASQDEHTNLRVGVFLETAAVVGALLGGIVGAHVNTRVLSLAFGGVLLVIARMSMRKLGHVDDTPVPPDAIADALALHDVVDEGHGPVPYRVTGSLKGLGFMVIAGALSGMLGVGGGVLKVAAMDVSMRLPLRVSTATSNFMIGVTASASALVAFAQGRVDPLVTVPVVVGAMLGAVAGARLLPRVKNAWLRGGFLAVLVLLGVRMIIAGVLG